MKASGTNGIAWLEAILLAAMAPLFLFPAADRTWPFLVFPVLWAARFWAESKKKSELSVAGNTGSRGLSECCDVSAGGTPLDAAVLLLAVWLFVSSVAAGDWEAMLPKIAGIVYGILVFHALARLLRTERTAGIAVGGFIAGGTALVAFGLTGMIVSGEPHFRKIVGFLFNKIPQKNWEIAGAEAGLNPNAVAGVMLLFVPLCLVLAVGWSERLRKGGGEDGTNRTKTPTKLGRPITGTAAVSVPVLCGLLSMIFLFVLFLTQAVAAWIALAAGLWFVLPSNKMRLISAAPTALFIAAVLVFLPHANGDAADGRDKAFWMKKIEDRQLRWLAGIDAVREKPLTGVGVNMLRQRPELGYERSHAHNHMLHTAAEMGIPGLAAYLAILGAGFWMCRSVWRRTGPGWVRVTARGLGAGQIAHFIFGWGDSIPLGAKPGIFFWVSLALIAALYDISKRAQVDEKTASGPGESDTAARPSMHLSSGFINSPHFLKCARETLFSRLFGSGPVPGFNPPSSRRLKSVSGRNPAYRGSHHGDVRVDSREKPSHRFTILRERKRGHFAGIVIIMVLVFIAFFPQRMSAQSSLQRRVLAVSAQSAVVSESRGRTDDVRAERLIRGSPTAIWRSRRGDAPPFVFVFVLAADSRIDLLRFHNSVREDRLPGAGAREVEVEFSTTGPESGYFRAGFFSLEKGGGPQDFRIPASRARWVRLTIHSNYGHPHFTELGEFEAWGQFDFHLKLLVSYFVWIAGAAIVLGTFGWHEHAARREKRRLGDVLRRPSFLRPAAVGAVFIGAGIAASARGPGLAVLGTVVLVAAAAWLIRAFLTGHGHN